MRPFLKTFCCVLPALLALSARPARAADFVFKEDFEGAAPRLPGLWASNVTSAKINFAGVTEERAFSGKKSFKLDVTLNGGSYYYYSIPLRIPLWAPLKFQGRLSSEEPQGPPPRLELGCSWDMPSVGESGYTIHGRKLGRDANGWEEWSADLASLVGASDTALLSGAAVYIYAPPGGFKDTHVVLYVDDLEVQGALPAGYEQELDRRLKAIVEARRQQTLANSRRLRQRAATVLAQIKPVSTATLPAWAAESQSRLEKFVRQNSEPVRKDAALLETAPEDAAAAGRLNAALPLLEVAVRALNALPAYAARHGGQPYVTSIANPMQDLRILPDSFPLAAVPGAQIQVEAAAGEYEPASFVVSALQDLKQVKLDIAPLRRENGKGVAPVGSTPTVDARLVKVWWQAGLGYTDTRHPQLTPELLLHDDSFVAVDPDPKLHRNTLKNPAAPRDAATLQPLDIPAGTHQQFWLTIHVPENASGGDYVSTLTITPANAAPLKMELRVRVYPFRLEAPYTENAIYYRGRLSPDGKPQISTEFKSEEQFRAELRDMKQHGVTLPSIYTHFRALPDGTFDFAPLQRVLDIYRAEGLTDGPLVLMTPIPFEFMGKSEAERQTLLEKVRVMATALEAFRRQHDYPRLAVYAIDEAVGERLRAENEAFRVINEAGGMVAVAVGTGFFAAAGEWLNRPIIAGGQPEIYPAVHARGHKVWIYGRPQVGPETPEIYRRNYGLLLWKRDEDGACPYAYQATDGNPTSDLYDDFASPSYRSMAFTYPTIDGVIDTVQWEGHREGIDDVRYLSTLLKRIEAAKKNKKKASLATQAQQWLEQVDVEGDLTALRHQMAEWIVKLQ